MFEDRLKLVILLAIMLASLAASFTHMKDWTMHWLPAGTDAWFGWSNAVISELVPLVATLSLRKRLRQGKPLLSYALFILLAGAVLSLAAQLSAVGANASWSARFLACLPSLAFLLLSKLVMSDLDDGRKHLAAEAKRREQADADAARHTRQLAEARAETAAARAELADTAKRLTAETARAQAEARARTGAETALAHAEQEAETRQVRQAEIEAETRAEILRLQHAAAEARDAAQAAQDQAASQAEAAQRGLGQLAEAQAAADRAHQARVLAEQHATATVRQVTDAGQETERGLRQELAQAHTAAQDAREQITDLTDRLHLAQAHGDDARRQAERQTAERIRAEQYSATVTQSHREAVAELERLRRALVRAQQRPETGNPGVEISGGTDRKSLSAVPAALPEILPEVETVRPETVALVLAARAGNPDATQAALSAVTGVSARTIRKVLNAVPADVIGQVLALTGSPPAA